MRSLPGVIVIAGLMAGMASVGQAGEDLLTEKILPLELLERAAHAAIASCAAKERRISVVMVDAYGNTKLMLVSDGGIYTTADSARRKAYTAAMMRQATSSIQQRIAANPGAPLPGDGNPAFLFLAGGLPIWVGSQVVGAIGVGGAASEQDELCAQAGIDGIQAFLH
ncbi:MAG: hypothetical protein RL684_2646 [Pseudomonadota bacterium]|jgi:uncharacterized protein GlcG (DUF336 family)